MKLLGRKKDEGDANAEPVDADEPVVSGGTTAPKGKPTPKRNESANAAGRSPRRR